ncbi:MAG TPA: hypothetical protein VI318_20270 [Baekduia sp.]
MIRTRFLLPAAVAASLALAACGSSGNSPNNGKAPSEDKTFEGAVRFAQCMRQHGVQMSDPQRTSDGGIVQKAGGPGKGKERGDLGPGNPRFDTAQKVCGKYLVGGGGDAPSPAEQAERNDALIAYAQCMRGKGIDFPDPKIDGNNVSMMLGPGARPDSPKFKAADAACHPLMAKFGPKGGPGS